MNNKKDALAVEDRRLKRMVSIVVANKDGGATSAGILLAVKTTNAKRLKNKSGLSVGLAKVIQ